ncbi:MAG TPA: hypothetical protein VFW95_08010 [Candidatus Limnocylindria bacterium]|nr:hypothetical protein [Candidatus Limnocylindria bacterium]
MIPDVARLGRFGQLTVHLAGIQIELHAIFVAWLLVLGLAAQRTGVSLAIWVVVAGVAVFVHELGHAAAYRAFGVTPRIVLSAVFGLTYGAELPLARSIVVSLAGSATGIVIGVAGLALQAALPAADGAVAVALADVVFVGLGWAVINLLPVLPLDGGQATRAAIRATGWRHAEAASLLVSLATALAVGVAAAAMGYWFLALFIAWFGLASFDGLRELRESPLRARLNLHGRQLMSGDSAAAIDGLSEIEGTAKSRSVATDALTGLSFALLAEGRWEEAEGAFMRHPQPAAQPLLWGALQLHRGRLDPQFGALLADRNDAVALMGTLRAVVDTSRFDDVLQQVDELGREPSDVALRAMLVGLSLDGLHERAVRVGVLLHARQPRWNEVSFFVASSLGALGRTDEALLWLERAAVQGAGYAAYIERDPNLEAARALPAYAPIRARIASNAKHDPPDTGELLGDESTDAG